MEALTVEDARSVKLPINPISRIRKVGELAAGYRLIKGGLSPLPLVMTRRGLIRMAEIHEESVGIAEAIVAITDRLNEEGELDGENI